VHVKFMWPSHSLYTPFSTLRDLVGRVKIVSTP
jgi:hypothetical protein